MIHHLSVDLEHILDHTIDLWNDLRGQRIFITGGTGFIGRWLLESFVWANERLQLGATALVLTRRPDTLKHTAPHLFFHPAIHLHVGDISTFDPPAGSFSHLIHAATETATRLTEAEAKSLYKSIVHGTEHTLEFAIQRQIDRFLMVSSGAVYGKQPATIELVPEEYLGALDPMTPRSTYGECKRIAEMLCAIYALNGGIQPIIARGFTFFGPYMTLNGHYAIGNFLRDALTGGPIQINGDGTPYRSYLYAADMAIWLWTLLLRGKACHPYNVGSDQCITIREVANAVADCFTPKLRVQIAKQQQPNSVVERYTPAILRAKSELGLAQTINLRNGLFRWIKVLNS